MMADKKTLELQIKVLANQAQQQIKLFATDIKNAATQVKEFTKNNQDIKNAMGAIQAEAQRATNSLKLFGGSATELKIQTQKMKSVILDLVENGLDPESDEIKNLVKQYKNLDAQIEKTEIHQEGLAGTVQTLTKEIGSLAAVTAAVSFDKWVAGLAGSALSASTSFRAAKEDFGIMLGDMEAGAGLLAELQEFNFWTPFDLDQTSQAAKVLMAAKVPLGEITEYLTRFGDIAQGNGQRFQSFINAFSKASAKGKADMEVLNVYIDQGVQILDALGEQMGVTSAEIVDMASKGEISFQDLDRALESMAAEGGLYYNSMATASQRLDAVQAGLSESVNALAASFGDMLAPIIAKVLEILTNLVDAINDSPFLKGVLAAALSAVVVVINTKMITALISLAAKIWATYAAQMGLNSAMAVTNPALIAATAAVAAATAGFVAYAAAQQESAEQTAEAALAAKKQTEALKDLRKEAEEYMNYLDGINLSQAQAAVDSYTNFRLPSAKESLDAAIAKKENTPQFLQTYEEEGYWNPLGVPGGTTINPAYEQAQKEVEEAQALYDRLLAEAETAQKKLEEIQGRTAQFGTEWQDKLLSDEEKLLKEKAASIAELKAKAENLLGQGWENNPKYKAEFDALIKYYETELEKLNTEAGGGEEIPAPVPFDSDWSQKNLSEVEKLEHEYKNSLKELKQAAEASFGDDYAQNSQFIGERIALETYYTNERRRMAEAAAEAERQDVLSAHEQRMAAIKEEFEYRRELARQQLQQGDVVAVGSFAQNAFASAASDTQAFELAASVSGGTGLSAALGPMAMFSEALAESVLSLESVQKVLNPISTILESMMQVVEPLINSVLQPIVKVLELLGKTLGLVLSPMLNILSLVTAIAPSLKILEAVLKVVGKAFEWFNNNVIVPVGNAIIGMVNAVIDLLNKIPFVDIDKIGKLQVVGEAAEQMSKDMERLTAEVNNMYERQKDAVRDLLESQLTALESQYELGLISRKEYEEQAQKYTKEADDKLIEINQLQAEILGQIEKNTYAAATGNTQGLDESRKSYAESLSEKWGEKAGFLGELAGGLVGGIADVGKAIWEGVKKVGEGIGKFFKGLFGFATGTTFVPQDMPAMIHQGEAIIPKTFMEGIRAGDLALVANSSASAASGSPVYVTVNVSGSVVSERELVDVVYTGIANGISTRRLTPLPVGVA